MANKLDENDICQFLMEILGLSVAREQLMHPTVDFVVNTYGMFLREFGIENVAQPDLMATSAIENIDRYESSIILWNIFKSVSSLVSMAGVPDMSFGDIVSPRRPRNNRILSALCFICCRLTEFENQFTQMQAKHVDLPARRQAVEQRIRDLNKKIDEKAVYLSNNKGKHHNMEKDMAVLAKNLAEKQSAGEELATQTKQLKTQLMFHREKLSDLDVEASKMKEEIHDLEQKIVKSPERIQADTDEKEHELEGKRTEKKKLERQYMELIRQADHLKEASKTLMPSLDTFTQAFKDIESLRSQCEKVSESKQSVSKRTEELKTLNVRLKEQEKSRTAIKHQMVNNEKQYQQQIETSKQITEGMKKDLELKTKNESQAQKNCLEERLRLESRLDALDSEHNQFMEKIETVVRQRAEDVTRIEQTIKEGLSKLQTAPHKRKDVLFRLGNN